MIDEIRGMRLNRQTQSLEQRSPTYRTLTELILSNMYPEEVRQQKERIRDLYARLGSAETSAFAALLNEREAELTRLKENSNTTKEDFVRTIQKLETITHVKKAIGLSSGS